MNLWTAHHAATIDIERFRAHDQFLEQSPIYPYQELTRWCRKHHPGLLDSFTEDGAFGCLTTIAGEGKTVSRDLLDSVCEIGFLEGVVDLSHARVLDIGAGYGRFAHRLLDAHPCAEVFCVDAIDISRWCCDKYLSHRGVIRAHVTSIGAVEQPIDLAVNVHSWSECSLDEVRGWLDWLDTFHVSKLFIVPHTASLGTWSPDKGGGNGESYHPELMARGWAISHAWTGPECCTRAYFLFERTAW